MEEDANAEARREKRARRPRSSPVILQDLGKVSARSGRRGAGRQASREFLAFLIAGLMIAGIIAALVTLTLHGH